MDITPRRRANPLRLQKPLGNGFVHGHAAAQIARAGVGYSQQIQRGLNTTVLAAGAVGARNTISAMAHTASTSLPSRDGP